MMEGPSPQNTRFPHGWIVDWPFFIASAVMGGLGSIAVSGFLYGARNNLFHLPILDALYDEPAFAHDAFIQSLRFYASGFWLLLQGAGKYVDGYWLFLSFDFLSRFLCFAGFLACAELTGIHKRRDRALFVGFLCLTPLLQNSAHAGGGGLFINYFTHSEIANGLSLLMLAALARGSVTGALALNGAVFFINAFMAVWNFVPLAAVAFYQFSKNVFGLRQLITQSVKGLFLFGLLAAPVLCNILANPEFGQPQGFDYITYLKQYFPLHVLFGSINLKAKIAIASIILTALLSFLSLGASARPFLIALGGYLVLYLCGIAAPYLTHNSLALNLHLLRASVMFHLLAALGTATVLIRWFADRDRPVERVLALLLAFCLCTNKYFVLLAPLPLMAHLFPWTRQKILIPLCQHTYFTPTLALTIILLWSLNELHQVQQNQAIAEWIEEWKEMGQWARDHTPVDSIFLVPIAGIDRGDEAQETPAQQAADNEALFEDTARRRVWIDFKRGAAVMWAPSYYNIWRPRISDLLAAQTHEARMDYARLHHMDFIIEHCEASQPASIFRTSRLCLFAVDPFPRRQDRP